MSDINREGDDDVRRAAARRRAARRAANTYQLPACQSWIRRRRLEKNLEKWLLYYGDDDPFVKAWGLTEQQREMAFAIHDAIVKGGDQALAASRGDGKTSLFEWVVIFLIATGKLHYVVYFASTEELSTGFISAILERLRENERLAADYPELCWPIRHIAGIYNRAKTYYAYGTIPTKKGGHFESENFPFKLGADEIHLPKFPGSLCGGAKLASRSLTGAVRGLKRGTERPQLACIDDPDRNLTHSEEQLQKLERIIDRGIGYLGGQKRGIARVMLTTVENHFGVSALFTDRERKPTWRGRRFKFLCNPPTDETLWADYVSLRQRDAKNGTELAHTFYLAHREQMDAGAVVANPNRKPDGSLTALQYFFNCVARTSRESVETELNNAPPIEELPTSIGLAAHRIQRQLSGLPQRIIPEPCGVVTRGIDINKRMAHWVVRAFADDGTAYTIDYGIAEVFSERGTDEGLEEAIEKALLDLFEDEETTPYTYEDGTPVPIKATFCDSRWQTGAVRQAIKKANELWTTRFYTVQGCGKAANCTKPNYRELLQSHSPDRRLGDGWHADRLQGVWEFKIEKERFLRYEHSRWLTVGPAANYLWGEASSDPDAIRLNDVERGHQSYARHITNEKEIELLDKGVLKRVWKATNNVHYLDASVYATAAALYSGISFPSFNLKTGPKKLAPGGPVMNFSTSPDRKVTVGGSHVPRTRPDDSGRST